MAAESDDTIRLVAGAGRVVAVSDALLDMIQYPRQAVLHLPVDLFFRSMLRATAVQADFQNLSEPVVCFIFSSAMQAIRVTIEATRDTLLYFIIREVPQSRLQERFFLVSQFFYSHDTATALLSWPDLIVLQANQCFLDYSGSAAEKLTDAFGRPTVEHTARHVRSVGQKFKRSPDPRVPTQTVRRPQMLEPGGRQQYWDETWTPIWDDGQMSMLLAIHVNVTGHVRTRRLARKQEDVIRRQSEELQAIIDNISDGLMLVDRERNIKLLNNSIRQLFYDPDNLKRAGDSFRHTHYYDLAGNELTPEDTVALHVLRGQRIQNRAIRCERPDRTIYLSESGSPIYDDKGQVEAAIVCSRDVTAQMERNKRDLMDQQRMLALEQRQRESLQRAMEMKDQFFSLVTHELKTPLAVIDLAVQAIQSIQSPEPTGKLQAYLQSIRQSNYRQLRLVNNLLDMARATSGHMRIDRQCYDIVALVEALVDSVRIFTEKKGMALSLSAPPGPLLLCVDAEKLERILLNLLSNAIKFSPQESRVEVELALEEDWLALTVRDQGIGIPPDKQELIFERFGQVDSSLSRRAEGTGIGLALVRQFAQALGGDVSVESRSGQGSAFTLRLPAMPGFGPAQNISPTGVMEPGQAAMIEFADVFS